MNSSDLALWLSLSTIPGLGLKTRLQLFERMPNFHAWRALSQQEAISRDIPKSVHALLQKPMQTRLVEKAMAWIAQQGVQVLTWADPDYPIALRQIPDPPWALFLWGNFKLIQQMQLAIVGARAASGLGVRCAAQFAHHLGDQGITITSGFARGVDRAAHAGALPTQGGTIAVLAHGFQHCYPRQHQTFFSELLAQGGLLLSEWLPCTAPRAAFFSHRNRLIAGLSRGVLVIEAGLRSGSLITARLAAEYGRDVFALPHAISHELGRGCHRLIRDGAFLVESPDEILENWQLFLSVKPAQAEIVVGNEAQPRSTRLCAAGEQVMACFTSGKTVSFDVLVFQSRLTAEALSSILLELEMQGQIESVAGGYRQIEMAV